jgi:hypothetical protein
VRRDHDGAGGNLIASGARLRLTLMRDLIESANVGCSRGSEISLQFAICREIFRNCRESQSYSVKFSNGFNGLE